MTKSHSRISFLVMMGLALVNPQDALAQAKGKGGPDCREIATIIKNRKTILSDSSTSPGPNNATNTMLRDQRLSVALLEIVATSDSNCAEIIAKIEDKFSPN
jgi:hypothetical protein